MARRHLSKLMVLKPCTLCHWRLWSVSKFLCHTKCFRLWYMLFITFLQGILFCSISGRELEGVNNLSSQILRRCFPTNKLPLSTLSSPLTFALLDLDSAGHSAVEDLLDDSGEGDYNMRVEILSTV